MKYKLIKTYPGSPVVGTQSGHMADGVVVSQYPEFWEAIKPTPDYEIQSFSHMDDGKPVYLLLPDGRFEFECMFGTATSTLEQMLSSEEHHIHSVKRLSDGEVFSVGDKVLLADKYTYVIAYLKVIGNTICVGDHKTSWQSSLEFIEKAKPTLFATHDGVDIKEGDEYSYVHHLKVFSSYARCTEKYLSIPEYYFSTKEAAEEYVILNKPVLSYNDVLKVINACIDAGGDAQNVKDCFPLLKNR